MSANVTASEAISKQTSASRRMPAELGIMLVLVGIALVFEVLGWIVKGQSFLLNIQRLQIMILQVSVIGIIAVGVTQVIITGGIDLSSGSVVALSAMVAASLAQSSGWGGRLVYPSLTDLPVVLPIFVGIGIGVLAGFLNGTFISRLAIPPFIATLGMMVSVRGLAKWYTEGNPVSGLTEEYTFIGSSIWPVIVFLTIAFIFHIALTRTRYGKFTYAIGANVQAARVSGIDVQRHIVKVYAIAGMLAGLAGVITSARVHTAQTSMGTMYELDAITAAVIGGTSLTGGVGRITGTVIGTIILGVITSGFTFIGLGAYYQEIAKGIIIVAAVTTDVYRRNRMTKK